LDFIASPYIARSWCRRRLVVCVFRCL